MGYHRAGFEVVGVDIDPQRRYPFEFHQADAIEVLTSWDLSEFDAIHASPPCQAYSITKHSHGKDHPELVGPTRDGLLASGLPFVMENVPGAPLLGYVELCGAAFGCETIDTDGTPLVLRRHRLFETNFFVWAPPSCACGMYRGRGYEVGGVYGGGSSDRNHAREVRRGGYTPGKAQRSELIGADWMTLHGLSQAIPPAYTEWIGVRLLEHLGVAA
jgi:DNA (cytosine-5)-methyltransferase 1